MDTDAEMNPFVQQELADYEWRKQWREKNARALGKAHIHKAGDKGEAMKMRAEWERLRKLIRGKLGDVFLEGVPIRGNGLYD